jgi:polyhydroxybutyrate depolymerase
MAAAVFELHNETLSDRRLRMRRLCIGFLLGVAVLAAGWLLLRRAKIEAVPPGHREFMVEDGGAPRRSLVYLPVTRDPAKAVPLVLMLHGMGGTAEGAANETGWSAKAEAEGFMVVYPQATRPKPAEPVSLTRNAPAWNDGSGRFHAAEQNVDDVGFIRVLLDALMSAYKIDPKRIYVTGFSNGASMTFRVGAELSDRIAAIAPGAGACWSAKVQPTRGISVCYITGTADTLNPLDGGVPRVAIGKEDPDGTAKPPVMDSIQKWVKALGCPQDAMKDNISNGVRTRRYGPGRDGAEVTFITVEGLGHMWAGGANRVPEFLVGAATDKLKATDVIWDFFLEHPKPSAGGK